MGILVLASLKHSSLSFHAFSRICKYWPNGASSPGGLIHSFVESPVEPDALSLGGELQICSMNSANCVLKAFSAKLAFVFSALLSARWPSRALIFPSYSLFFSVRVAFFLRQDRFELDSKLLPLVL